MNTETVQRRREPAIPLLGIPVLLVWLLVFGAALGWGGSGTTLRHAFWQDGVLWGGLTCLALGLGLFLARVRSDDLARVVAALFFAYVTVHAHVTYYDSSRAELHTAVQEAEPGVWPDAWKSLPPDELNHWFIGSRVTPWGLPWLDHLRAQADVGIFHVETSGQRRYGRFTEEVYRRGFFMWWGWFVCHAFLAVGCFFGMAGAAFVPPRHPPEIDLPPTVRDRIGRAVGDEARVQRVLGRPSGRLLSWRPALTPELVATLLPQTGDELAATIAVDLERAAAWARAPVDARTLPSAEAEDLRALVETFHGRDAGTPPQAFHLVLRAADRLRRATDAADFHDCLEAVTDVTRVTGTFEQVAPFALVDLRGIEFERVACAPQWMPLYRGTTRFFDRGSPWQQLEALDAGALPRDAHLAVIHQLVHEPDPRVHDFWPGLRPSELMPRIAPIARDAILTYVSVNQGGASFEGRIALARLAAWAAHWPPEEAERFLRRCIRCGWREALGRLPDDARWRAFVARHDPTPFGGLSGSTPWR